MSREAAAVMMAQAQAAQAAGQTELGLTPFRMGNDSSAAHAVARAAIAEASTRFTEDGHNKMSAHQLAVSIAAHASRTFNMGDSDAVARHAKS